LIREAINHVLLRDGAAAVTYESPEGYQPLREAIARRLTTQGIAVQAEDILITGGCQQALDLAVQALVNPGDVLLTTNPTYAGILDIAQARGVIAVGAPIDDEGMQTAALENLIIEHRPRLIYVAPTYHNPTGTVMPLHRRRQLLDIAAHYRVPVLEDAVYEPLSYAGTPPPPLKALDETGLVLYASSFSKIFLPGMRIGYLAAGGRLQQRLARVKRAADVCTPALNQRAIHAVLESGELWEHLAKVQAACQSRRTAMLSALGKHLPGATFNAPAGGLYVWVELSHDGPTATELFLHAVQSGVAFAMGPLFFTDGQGAHHLRLNIAAQSPDRIDEGIRRLGEAWRDLAAEYQPTDDSERAPFL
jgi:DNA-binding transcriptional MocR family regulator